MFISKIIDYSSEIDIIEHLLQPNMTEKKIQYDFDTLFQLSPYGLMVFNKNNIISVNNLLLDILKMNKLKDNNLKAKNLFEKSSWNRIKNWIKCNSSRVNASFKDIIELKNSQGERIEKYVIINKLTDVEDGINFIGFFVHPTQNETPIVNYHLANDICNLLKRENIAINESVEQKIGQAIKLRTLNGNNKENSFFTKRENEVLRLSIEGLSIKIIADKLSISSRTVEKHRARLMEKSGAKNIVEVIVFSLKNNLIEI